MSLIAVIAFRLTSISESLFSYVHPWACPAVRVSCLRTDLSVILPLFCISHICLCQLVLVVLRVPAYSCVFLRAAVGAAAGLASLEHLLTDADGFEPTVAFEAWRRVVTDSKRSALDSQVLKQ